MIEHELGILEFVLPERRGRYAEQLRNARTKFVARLPHFHHWLEGCVVQLAPRDHTATAVVQLLKARGAPPRCWSVSCAPKLDARSWDLDEAVRAVVGTLSATIVSCVPGRLAYYEGEEPGERFLLVTSSGSRAS